MTRPEFDAWITEHYTDLVKVARRRVNTEADALDVVHNAVAGALTGGWYARSARPWTRMVLAIRSYATRRREGDAALAAARRTLKTVSRASHGRRRPAAPRAD